MPLEFITHNGRKYLNHESIGGASLWIRPLAQYYCCGKGLDIGYSKEAWMLPNAVGIEPSIDPQWDAMKLPNPVSGGLWDYIHSSHCLEHVNRNIYDVLDYWLSKIVVGGIMFLYLPHSSQSYWHPSSNRKHVHSLNEIEIETYLNDLGHKVYVSGVDWNHSFVVICEKQELNHDLMELARKQDSEIPTGHYPVKDSLLYNLSNGYGFSLSKEPWDEKGDTDIVRKGMIIEGLNLYNKDKIRLDNLLVSMFNAGRESK